MAKLVPAGNHPATASPEDCPSGRTRESFPCASALNGLLGTTTSLSVSASEISSRTSCNTVKRSASTTASAPCSASPLFLATTAPGPICAASRRADSGSALESRRVSPPEPSRRAIADPIPPVPIIAVAMTETSQVSRYPQTSSPAPPSSKAGRYGSGTASRRSRGPTGTGGHMSTTPIADYALLSDRHSAALVSRAGSIDWLCFPRFDSPSILGRLLGDEAGHWSLRATNASQVTRRYLDRTMVLETTFRTPKGTVVVTDALAMGDGNRGHDLGQGAPHLLLRRATCLEGEI